MIAIDHIEADCFSPLGSRPVQIVDAASFMPAGATAQAVIIGIDASGLLPDVDPAPFDILLTSAERPPRPWIGTYPRSPFAAADVLAASVRQWPLASSILCQTLRINEQLGLEQGILVESLAYSTLLRGREFAQWKRARPFPTVLPSPATPILVERDGDHVTLTLNDPATGNAITTAMRDALYEALVNIADDPTSPEVTLCGTGKCFSTGGALVEFGTAPDAATAHAARTLHSCTRLLASLEDRVTVHLHGACIGSGMEIPAAASHRIAHIDSWFQLPELRMGLIPGAGGTVSIARAIGRHRCAWMLLSGRRISAATARHWGLVHKIAGMA